jgi:hypothetical protein
MRYEFPTLRSVRYLAMARDLKPWIWLAVAGAAMVIGFIFDLPGSATMSLLVVIAMATATDSMIMDKIDARKTHEKFNWMMNFISCNLSALERALTVVKADDERFKIIEPLLNLLANPIYGIEERKDWILQLPPLTRNSLDRYCQVKLKEQERVYNSPSTTRAESDRAEDAMCNLEELITILKRQAH